MRRLPPKLPEAVLLQTIAPFQQDFVDFYFVVGDETFAMLTEHDVDCSPG